MKFGEKGIKICKKCGKEFEGYTQSKYCNDGCKPERKNHKKKVEEVKEVKDDAGNVDDNNNITFVNSDGDIQTNNNNDADVQQRDNGVQQNGNSQTIRENGINSIQIIDSNTGKKDKGIVDQIFEKAFSEEFAPITTALLGALVSKLQQPNNEVSDGMLTAEDGTKHEMI